MAHKTAANEASDKHSGIFCLHRPAFSRSQAVAPIHMHALNPTREKLLWGTSVYPQQGMSDPKVKGKHQNRNETGRNDHHRSALDKLVYLIQQLVGNA